MLIAFGLEVGEDCMLDLGSCGVAAASPKAER
jgi:hypothetical protein